MLKTLYDHIRRWVEQIPAGPIGVTLPEAERAVIRMLITRLGDRRLLSALECKVPRGDMIESCNTIRANVTSALEALTDRSESRQYLIEIRIACHNFQKFLEEHLRGEEYLGEVELFFAELGELRGATGRCLARVCRINEIDIDRDLKHLLTEHGAASPNKPMQTGGPPEPPLIGNAVDDPMCK